MVLWSEEISIPGGKHHVWFWHVECGIGNGPTLCCAGAGNPQEEVWLSRTAEEFVLSQEDTGI